MSKQQVFFLDKWEIFQKEHPEKFSKKGSSRKKSPPKVYNCETCGLKERCRSPHIKKYGKGKKGILFVGQCPGYAEDKVGIPFVGAAGGLLKRTCNLLDINLDEDCVRTNIVSCYPGKDGGGKDKDPADHQIKCCSSNLEKDIQEVQPKLIVCFGTLAIKAVLQTRSSIEFSASMVHGKVFPYHKYNCWVGCSYHPAFFLHRKNSDQHPDDEAILAYDLANVLSRLDDPLPQPLTAEGNECITDPDEVISMLEDFCDSEKPVAFDYETNHMVSPYPEGARIKTVALTNDVDSAIFIPLDLKDQTTNEKIFNLEEQAMIVVALRKFLQSDAPKVVQNYNMEELWGRNLLLQPMNNFIHDTMVTAHVLDCHPRMTGLGFQAFEMTGHDYKGMVDLEDIDSRPLKDVCNYNSWDARYTLMSYYRQKSRLEGNLIKFNDFFTSSIPVLANLTDRGIKIDLNELDNLNTMFSSEMEECKNQILSTEAAKKFEEEKGKELEITSPTQLGQVIYDICKVEKTRKRLTPTRKGATNELVFQEILNTTEDPEVKKIISSLFTYRKNTKVIERVAEYRRLVDSEGFIHPTYNLNIATSFRSSSDGPNIQNVFIHDEEQKKFRRCIVPRPGHIFLEPDYDALEVRVMAMASRDPVLTQQIIDGVDPHRIWASRIFQVPQDQITTSQRYKGKNGFVFPRFYGSVEESIIRYFPEVPKDHMLKVCREFWEEYHYVKEWQLRTISEYRKKGYVELMTGARRPGPLSINKLYNTPIQGPAYHLLQDALNKNEEALLKSKTITCQVAEIHDDILLDTHPDEAEEVIELVEKIMCSKRFDWQRNVPLSVSWDVGIRNWYEMEPLKV